MSQILRFGTGIIPPGTFIEQIDGDVGFVSGAVVSFNATPTAGSTVQFNGSGTTMLFEVTDGNGNTIIGNNAGNGTLSGDDNVGLGYSTLSALTTGSTNTALGFGSGNLLSTGSNNVFVGNDSGQLVSTGSYNIQIGKITGTGNESDVTRIGNTGQTSSCYILGIGGVDVGSVANIVTEDSDQLGTAVLSAGANIDITAGPNIITISSTSSVVDGYVTVNHAASPYSALSTDYYISADVTAGVITIRLPNAPTTGRSFIIKDKVGLAAASNITVTTVGGAVNIDGATSFVMNTAYQAINVIFGGTAYEVY